ncbi:MAG TPA: quinone-dependent dihydroorotate dehydrogenase [Rhodocyclaceae bacterium]|nr:quinone-dependent dihydroorotate dehydrogenase [Rhodocyclaceae bacterium]
MALPPIPYALVRPLLFTLDPEQAHELTLAALSRYGKCVAPPPPPEAAPVTVMGLRFPNRVGLAAGLDKNGIAVDGLAHLGFGAIEVGTVTPRPQPGNPKPRLFRLPEAQALINRMGFNNDGVDRLVANVQRQRAFRDRGGIVGLNIGKNASTPIERATDDYITCLDGVYPHADYVTVNISSPNTQNLRSLQSDAALDALLGAVAERREQLAQQSGRRIPVFLKIAPDLDDAQIEVIAATLMRYGAASDGTANNAFGVIATNTTLSREAVAGMPHAEEAGGLSGAPVLQASNQVIRRLRACLGKSFPIIGVGGIMSGEDAVSKIQAGANVVQIYTGLIYKGPALVKESALAIKAHAQRT